MSRHAGLEGARSVSGDWVVELCGLGIGRHGGGGTSCSLRTKLVSPRNSPSTCVAQRWPASRMRRAELTWPSCLSHSSEANRGEPHLSGRKRTPHSTQPCFSEISLSFSGSTLSSAPQKPRHLSCTGTSAAMVNQTGHPRFVRLPDVCRALLATARCAWGVEARGYF